MKTSFFSPLKTGLAAFFVAGALSVPAMASPAPVNAPAVPAASAAAGDIIQVRDQHRRWDRRDHRRDWDRRDHRPHYRGSGFYLGFNFGTPAYRYVEPRRYYRPAGDAHVRWCYNRYRSYRAWDNSFQPYNGPRRQCRSPYF